MRRFESSTVPKEALLSQIIYLSRLLRETAAAIIGRIVVYATY
jgi:hypothetical protein